MTKKNLGIIIVVIIVVLGIGLGVGWYLGQDKGSVKTDEEVIRGKPYQGDIMKEDKQIIKDDFSILVPEGWREVQAYPGTMMTVMSDHETTDTNAQKINFKTYYAVTFDTLSGRTYEGYIDWIKENLKSSFPSLVFRQENDLEVNNKQAQALEFDLNQQGVDYRSIIVLIKGDDDKIWQISFSTTQKDFPVFSEVFGEIYNSFKLKLK